MGPMVPEKEVQMLKDFKEFAMRGNVVDMAVGLVIGAAFATIVKSLVADVLMPPVGLMLGGVDFANLFAIIRDGSTAGPFSTLAAAQSSGAVTINYGVFLNTIISFIIIAAAIFMVVNTLNKMKREEQAAPAEPTEKDCSHCFTMIPIKATRCPHCTSELTV